MAVSHPWYIHTSVPGLLQDIVQIYERVVGWPNYLLVCIPKFPIELVGADPKYWGPLRNQNNQDGFFIAHVCSEHFWALGHALGMPHTPPNRLSREISNRGDAREKEVWNWTNYTVPEIPETNVASEEQKEIHLPTHWKFRGELSVWRRATPSKEAWKLKNSFQCWLNSSFTLFFMDKSFLNLPPTCRARVGGGFPTFHRKYL